MRYTFPGFPTEISEPIDLPDIGELLISPAFQGIGPEEYLQHATDFQRHLFDKLPLKHDKKYVVIRSGVWLLEPRVRSHVKTEGDWHVDTEVGEFGKLLPERFFILSSFCSSLTQFNTTPISLETEATDPEEVLRKLRHDQQIQFAGRTIEPHRIYSVENHIHRAVEPSRIEFRFFLRVAESDYKAPWTKCPMKALTIKHCDTREERINVEYHRASVQVYYPGLTARTVSRG